MREVTFGKALMIALSRRPDIRVHRQNVGSVAAADLSGEVVGRFIAGPPKGAADISGIVGPYGWRLEVETKSATAEDTAPQEAWGLMIRRMGGIYVHVRYQKKLSLTENVARAVAAVVAEIERRKNAP